jgi:hypothetical protein
MTDTSEHIIIEMSSFYHIGSCVQTEVSALKLLLPRFTINTLADVINVQPPAAARVVAAAKSTVIAFGVTVIPVLLAGGLFDPPIFGSGSSVEQLVKNATPNMDMTAIEPDFLRKSLLASESDPDLMLVVVFMI